MIETSDNVHKVRHIYHNVDVYENLVDEVAVIRDIRTAEAQLDAGMGIPHEIVEGGPRERYLK